MKRRTTTHTTLLALALLLGLGGATGCSVTESTNVKTSGIWARFVVDHDENDNVTVRAILRVGGQTGTIIDLTGGDYMEVNGSQMAEWVEPLTNFHWSRAVIDPTVDDLYDLTFIRPDETVSTIVEVPDLPVIGVLDPGDVVLSGETLTINWDTTFPGDEVDLYISGLCIDSQSYFGLSDSGSYTSDPIIDYTGGVPSDCTLTVEVHREITGTVNTAFQDGWTEAYRRDVVEIDFQTTL